MLRVLRGDVAWAENVAKFASDAELRTRLAIEGRQRVLRDYSIESVFLRMRSVFAALS